MSTLKNWYAVYTRPKWEKKVTELLSRKKIENYCPLHKSVKQRSYWKKNLFEPLFNSYVFVYVNESEHLSIKRTEGVLNFVYWLGKPAVIKNVEIDAIRNFLNENQKIRLEKIMVSMNDKVTILDGAFKSWKGDVAEMKPKLVKVLLPSLGYALVAEIPESRISVIPAGSLIQVNFDMPTYTAVVYPSG